MFSLCPLICQVTRLDEKLLFLCSAQDLVSESKENICYTVIFSLWFLFMVLEKLVNGLRCDDYYLGCYPPDNSVV